MEQQIREMATKVIDEVVSLGKGDLCELVFKQLPGRVFATRMPDLKIGEPTMLLSNFMNGVSAVEGSWTPPRA